jgi:hypothetical protein
LNDIFARAPGMPKIKIMKAKFVPKYPQRSKIFNITELNFYNWEYIDITASESKTMHIAIIIITDKKIHS